MSNLEQNKAIANDPREEINADLAVGMVYSGFHVFIDKSDEQLTYDMVFGRERFDFENNTSFTAPMMEVAQYNATEALCEKFDSLNDDVRADLGMSLEEYADELFDNYESEFMWKDGLSEWENIRVSILSGETEYLRYFLNDVSVHYSSRTADLLEDLHEYETNYLEKNIGKQEPLITVSGQSGTNNSFDVTSVGFDTGKKYTVAEFNQALKAANERWQENWDGISYPSNIVIVTVENLHSSPCSYRINLTDDHNSIQDIVEMLPTPMLASLSTEKAIEMLNNAESVPGREEITLPADLDKFYVDRDNEEVRWVYYNPDSSAGGQLVYNYFSFDKLREAFSQNENAPLDVIAEDCQQFLVDKGAPEFIVSARHFLNSSCDFTNEDKNFQSELRALTLKIGDVVQFQHSRSGEPPQTLNAVVMRTSHKDAQYSSVRGYAFAMDAYDARDTAFSLSKGGFGFASALSFAREYKFEFAGNVEELRRKDHEQNVELYSALEEHKTIALQFNSEPEKDGVIFKAKSAGYDNFRLKWFNEDIGEIEKGYVLIADREKAFDVPLINYGELGERGAEALAFDLKKSGLAAYDFSLKEDVNLQKQDKTFAYEVGHSAPFTVVHLDIGTAERKTAVSEALKNIIYNAFGERNDMSQPYKNLLEQIKPDTEFIHASEGHLSSLKYALRNAESNKELCISMLDSIKDAERNPEKTVVIKGYACLPKDAWEEHGVKFTIGQSVDDTSFYYARATDGKTTRDYEYDYKPDREKVISDHADKLAEEDIDRGEAIYGADGYLAFPDTELKHSVEHIPQQRDISHNTTNADLSAKRGESRGNIMEQSTKFEVSTMSKLDGDGPAKAIGTLIVNGEFAVHGIKVVDGKNGLYVAMPSEKRNGGYEDVVFPVTKEARAAIDSAVLGTYEKLAASPEATIKNDIVTPTKPVSTVYAQMHNVDSDKTQTKAAGQITIDKCFVVTGVKLNEGTNSEGQTKTFVAMPAKPNPTGGYDDVAHPITADFHSKVDKAVIASANNIGRYEYKGVKYAELGENPVTSKPLHPKFADKLMAQLDKAGIVYQAKCAETVVISVKAADKQTFDAAQKELTAKLNGKDKPQKKQEQTTGTQNHTH